MATTANRSTSLQRAPAQHVEAQPTGRLSGVCVALLLVPIVLVLGGGGLIATKAMAPGAVLIVLGLVVGVVDLRVGAPSRLIARIGGAPAEPVRDARLINIVDGLCVAMGLSQPNLVVLADVAENALLLGSAEDPTLIVTRGLLDALDRIGLEGLVAHELAHAKRGDLARARFATLACGFLVAITPRASGLVARAMSQDREVLADFLAVATTRYPPGLTTALDTIANASSSRPKLDRRVAALTASLWCAPLAEAQTTRVAPGALDFDLRRAALREL